VAAPRSLPGTCLVLTAGSLPTPASGAAHSSALDGAITSNVVYLAPYERSSPSQFTSELNMKDYNFLTVLQQESIYNALEHSLYQLRTRIAFFRGIGDLLTTHQLYKDFTQAGQTILATLLTNQDESIDIDFIDSVRFLTRITDNNDLEKYQIRASHSDIANISLAIGRIKEAIPQLTSAIKILTSSTDSISQEVGSLFTMAETNVLLLKTELEALESILIPRMLAESVA
jgi:hypothetical protein